MNDKQRFLDELTAALGERGISDVDIAPYIEQFDRFYDRMRSDASQTANLLGDVDGIADNIAAQVSDKYDAINRLAEKTMTVDAVSDDDIRAVEDELSTADDAPTSETDIADIYDDGYADSYEDDGYEDEYEASEEGDEPPLIPVEMLDELGSGDIGAQGEDQPQSNRLPDYVPKEDIPNTKMFWILFALSLPITLPLALAAVSVFAAAWAALAALILGAIVALAGAVAIGTGLALVGIVYGTVKMFESIPVGLYEIGAGIIVAGLVMFISILLYNFAVRLVPLVIKQVWRLFRYLLGRLKDLFNHLRRESAKL